MLRKVHTTKVISPTIHIGVIDAPVLKRDFPTHRIFRIEPKLLAADIPTIMTTPSYWEMTAESTAGLGDRMTKALRQIEEILSGPNGLLCIPYQYELFHIIDLLLDDPKVPRTEIIQPGNSTETDTIMVISDTLQKETESAGGILPIELKKLKRLSQVL